MPRADCVFCAVVQGETPAHEVLRDDVVVAFLDHRPVFPGHVLVVTADHVETLPDLPTERVGAMFERVQRMASAVQQAMGADGTFVAINNTVSQSVPHLHVHVVPRRRKDGLRGFFWPRTRYRDEAEMATVASRIASAVTQPDA